ncbi:S-layer homology domain-containing protein [Paenibacillus agricola]|uniref:S-layer homology domain-containing protein n=1 Tax=Paenibacillus agricola TaxID=2716264 RepID=A0ABX0J2T2_9BACL|nr:S-layer homology domain-containing protein [Paenibacillus agricola]NHN28436.1 S-layer homology domain-containing protein [Paenibacillus agricola]
MKTIGIASIASLFLFSSIAQASAMPAPTVTSTPHNHSEAATTASPVPEVHLTDDEEVPADTKIKREHAIELAKQYVAIPNGYILLEASYQHAYDELSEILGSWTVIFTKEKEDGFYGEINVSIDSDSGKLHSFYTTEDNPHKKYTFPPKVNMEQAKQIALDYINQLNPDDKLQFQYDNQYENSYLRPLIGEVEYPLNFVRMVNGIAFPSNYIMLSVNDEGQIRSYMKQWDSKIVFKAPVKPISASQASEQFKKFSEVYLQYLLPDVPNGTASPAIAYMMDSIMVDAETGEALSTSGNKLEKQAAPVPVSDKPLLEANQAALNLTKEQAAIRVATLFPLPKDAKLQDAYYNESTDPVTGVASYEWELNWSALTDKKEGPSIQATINSRTGAITAYSKYDYSVADTVPTQPEKAALSKDQLKAKAIETVKKLLPSYAHELFLDPEYVEMVADESTTLYNTDFYFHRIINGVHTQYDTVSVYLNQATGELEGLSSSLTNSLYPATPPKVISEETAKEILLSQYQVEQQYAIVEGLGAYTQTPVAVFEAKAAATNALPKPIQGPSTRLVYHLKPIFEFRESTYLDAVSGLWKNNETNQVVQPHNSNPEDMKGHKAEEALKLMLDYDLLDVVDGKVKPDALITRGELVKMLIGTINGNYYPVASDYAERAASFSDVGKDSKYFPYVESAIDYNLIDRASGIFQPDAALNRAEVADLIVRALGYKQLSEVEGLFNKKATDIDDLNNQGAIAIVSALQIMGLEGNTFSPYEQVTRAQAATTFYNFLKALSQLQNSGEEKV